MDWVNTVANATASNRLRQLHDYNFSSHGVQYKRIIVVLWSMICTLVLSGIKIKIHYITATSSLIGLHMPKVGVANGKCETLRD